MKLWKILIFVLLVGAGIFAFRSCRETSYTNFPPRAAGDWIALGDSLTSGIGAAQGSDYPTLLSQALGRPVRNMGVPGATTEHGLNRIDEIVRLQPRVVLLCLGGNDGLQQLSMDKTFANLSIIIDRLHESGAFVVLIGVRSASVSDRYAKPFKKLAAEKKVLLIPNILKGVLGSPSLMSDYIHPNDDGYKAIAGRIEETVRPLLPTL